MDSETSVGRGPISVIKYVRMLLSSHATYFIFYWSLLDSMHIAHIIIIIHG